MPDERQGDRIPVSNDVKELYLGRCEHHRSLYESLKGRSRRFSAVRLGLFLGIVVVTVVGLWDLPSLKIWALGAGGLGVVGFFLLARIHDGVIRASGRHKGLLKINQEALLRLERRWRDLPAHVVMPEFAGSPVAKDLDLIHLEENRASLVRLLGNPATPAGKRCLCQWLVEPAGVDIVQERQAAVGELAGMLDFRQELELAGRDLLEKPHNPKPFLEWAEGEQWLSRRKWLIWTARIVPAVTFVLVGLNIAGILPAILWISLVILSLLFNLGWSIHIRALLGKPDWSSRAFGAYACLFEATAEKPFESVGLVEIKKSMEAGGLSAHRQMRRLDRINSFAEARYYAIHFLLQAFLFWDFHVLLALERWQTQAGKQVRRWLSVLGEMEALGALAGLRHDHPEWAVPEFLDGAEARLEAEAIGHPLLHPDSCVVNDVSIGPRETFLLITGSNMSGKSTLLRAVGVNTALAQAGGPVCARAFRLSGLSLGTSFRIHDVLEDGVSYFMAELRRLKEIIDLARSNSENGGRSVLFLFDEILLGTNVFERQVAVRRVIDHLMELGAIGSIATHDLSLADAEELSEACRPFHFTESYEDAEQGSRMVFDYKLRPGVAPTTNALKLLELVGITSS